jgi:hypothetical protein
MICLLFLCLPFLAEPGPAPAVPDGAGGWVPFTNSRVLPSGELRPFDPALDGWLMPDGSVVFPGMQPPHGSRAGFPSEPPSAFPSPPQHNRRSHVHEHLNGACYDQNGKPVKPVPPDCMTEGDGEPMPGFTEPPSQATPGPRHDPDHERGA